MAKRKTPKAKKEEIKITPEKARENYLNSLAKELGDLRDAITDKNKVKEEIIIYKKAIQIDENFYTAYNNLGNLLKSKGKIDEAKFYYQKAIKIKPKFGIYYKPRKKK